MKKLLSATISFFAAALCLSGTATYAAADAENTTNYPDSFTQYLEFSSLSDYAVGGNARAFAQGREIKVIENDGLTVYSAKGAVTALDYADGQFYYAATGGSFTLNGQAAEYDFSFSRSVNFNNFYYYMNGGEVVVLDKRSNQTTPLTGYNNLKQYGETAYAVHENALYVLNGTQTERVILDYTDYTSASKIYTGDCAQALKLADSQNRLKSAVVTAQTDGKPVYLTEVNLANVNDEYFNVGDTVIAGESGAPRAGDRGLLLCETGNACIIALNDKTYITSSANAEIEYAATSVPAFNRATTSVDRSCYAYSAPFISESTQLFALETSREVIVESYADRQTFGYLAYDFYLISYVNEDGDRLKGYVPAGYLSEFTFVEKPPQETADPDYSQEDLVREVVLILVVVGLVLVAAGYMIYVGTNGKRKNKKEKSE